MADLFAKYHCTYCQEDITGLRVKCTVCPDFDLCLQCFSLGAESGPHKNDHPYRFMDSGTMGVFSGKNVWSAREEMRLLDAIEQYGFGNWEDIARHIETRTPEEAKDEYVARYLEGNIGRLTWPAAASSRPTLEDTTGPDVGPLSPAVTARLPPLDATKEEASLLGYMPQRDDFEREFDNEAEALVSPLFVNSVEDEDIDIALKLCHVDMYTRKLRERSRRKRLCRDFQLVSNYFSATRRDKPSSKKKTSKFERELREKLRVFSQFFTAQEHESLVRSLVRQEELALRVRELERYRRNGISRFEECTHFEQQRARHEHIRDKISGSSGHTPSAASTETKNEERKSAASYYSSARRCTPSLWCVNSLQDSSGEGAAASEGAAGEGGEAQPLIPELPLLSDKEKKLCNSLSLPPFEYLSVKAQALKEGVCDAEVVPTRGADCPMLPPNQTSVACPVKQLLISTGMLKSG